MWVRILALFLVAALSGCGLPRNVVVLLPDEGGTVGKMSVEENNTTDELSAAYAADDTTAGKGTARAFKADQKTVDKEFASTLATTPRKPANFVIYFLLGETQLDPRSVDTLNAAIKAADTTPFADISVAGHSDAIGNDDANFVLPMYRARKIQADLIAGGVRPSTIDVEHHGSNNPRVPRPRGVPEPENRRVEVTIR
jgi:OmpA-OmpF porin, OOP family